MLWLMTVGIGKEGETVSILRARIVTFLPSFLPFFQGKKGKNGSRTGAQVSYFSKKDRDSGHGAGDPFFGNTIIGVSASTVDPSFSIDQP